MPILKPEQLVAQLKKNIAPMYVVQGEEELIRVESVDAIRAQCQQKGYSRTAFVVENAGFDWQEIVLSASEGALFAELKLLEIHVVQGKVGKRGGEILQEWAKVPPQHTTVLLVLPKLERAQSQSAWFQALGETAQIIEAKAVKMPQLPSWIKTRLRQQGLSIDDDALAQFAQRVEGNLLASKQEIDKLALLYPKGSHLTVEDIQNVIANMMRFDVFQLASAWLAGDTRRLVRLLDGLQTQEHEPSLLLWALSEDIRMLIRLTAFLKQGGNVQSARQEFKLWGDKQQLAPQALDRLKTSRLLEALQECAKIDRQIKGVENGEAWASLKALFIKLSQ